MDTIGRKSFILFSSQGLGLDYTLSLCIASAITFITVLAYIRDMLCEPGAAVTSGC